MNRWQVEQKIVIKALKDPAFKKKLMSKPKEAVRECVTPLSQKVVDVSLFDKINIRIVEEKKDEWVLTMPYLQAATGTLTDAELEKTASGTVTTLADVINYIAR